MTLTVVKLGGGAGLDPVAVCPDIAALVTGGRRAAGGESVMAEGGRVVAEGGRVVVLHGGSAEVDRIAGKLGVPQRRLRTPGGTFSRYTDPATLEVLTMVLAGLVKPRLLAEFHRLGLPAVGLTGIDAGILRAQRDPAHRAEVDGRQVMVRDDMTGRIRSVTTAPLNALLDNGLTPVLSPPALAQDGTPVNVDADRAAAAVAVALKADRLLLLTNVPGVLGTPGDDSTLIPRVVVDTGTGRPIGLEVGGGMAVKLRAAGAALAGGVPHVVIADGRALKNEGEGTRIVRGADHD